MSTTVTNSTLKATLSMKVGNQFLAESTFSVANINEVDNRVMTVPVSEVSLVKLASEAAHGTYKKANVRLIAITNRDDTNYIRLRLKRVINGIYTTTDGLTSGSAYKNGTYTNIDATGGTGTGAKFTIVVSGTVIFGLGTITGGTGYANGTYTGVALTGGTGTGAQATIVIAGGIVTSVTITTRGTGYAVSDNLSAADASLGSGGGSGFLVPVATLGGGVTSATITAGGQDYTVGDNLSVLTADIGGGNGSGFIASIDTVSSLSDIVDHKLEAGRFYVLGNAKMSADTTDSAFDDFTDIEYINAEADTDAVDVELYVASV